MELNLSWSKNWITSKISITHRLLGNPDANPPVQEVAAIETTGATFQINNAKLYVLVVTLFKNDNIKFLENIKQGFKRTICSNKYRSKITTQTKNNNLDYLIDRTFRNINGFFVLSFKNSNIDPTRNSFDKHYMPLVEIKDFNELIENKPFFDQSVKTNKKPLKNLLNCQEIMIMQQEIY